MNIYTYIQNRHMQDRKANLEYYTICRNGKIQKIYCQDINPGDIVRLYKLLLP